MTEFEKIVKDRMEEKGWTVYHNGWPDLLCIKGNQIRAIEVKSKTDSFRGNQESVLRALSAHILVQTAHPGLGYGDAADSDKFHLLDVDSDTVVPFSWRD